MGRASNASDDKLEAFPERLAGRDGPRADAGGRGCTVSMSAKTWFQGDSDVKMESWDGEEFAENARPDERASETAREW